MSKLVDKRRSGYVKVPNPGILVSAFGDMILEAVLELKINGWKKLAVAFLAKDMSIIKFGEDESFSVSSQDLRQLFKDREMKFHTWGGRTDEVELLSASAPKAVLAAIRKMRYENLLSYRKGEKMYSRRTGEYVGTFQGVFDNIHGQQHVMVRKGVGVVDDSAAEYRSGEIRDVEGRKLAGHNFLGYSLGEVVSESERPAIQ